MSEQVSTPDTPDAPGASGRSDGGPAPEAAGPSGDAYQVLRTRLSGVARELARRAEALNAARQEVFGSTELRLAGAARLRTARPALPADIAAVGPYLLFAANPADVEDVGDVADVFRAHRADRLDGDLANGAPPKRDLAEGDAGPGGDRGPAGLLDDPGFVRDFRELYRYYRQTRVVRVRAGENRVLAVFRTGAAAGDVKVLGWRIGRDGRCAYEGASREEPAEPPETVRWSAVGREAYVPGRHPHIALAGPDGGTLTLDTTGGALTLRTGGAVHEEPVDDALQSLADAEVGSAGAGPLVLLRVRPYREAAARYFAVNTRTEQVERIDALGQVCLRLPDDQGVVFPGGYVLATGGTRTFDLAGLSGPTGPAGPAGAGDRAEPAGDAGAQAAGSAEVTTSRLEFERAVRSADGEDVLYVFHAPADGRRLLLPYNLIRKEAAAPLHVQGSALYEDGTLITLRPAEGGEPGRVHTLQRWHTPFLSDTYAAARPVGDGPLARIGNPDLVRAVSDALSVARAALAPEPAAAVYEALGAAAERVLDRHHWLADPAAQDLAGPLTEVRDTARQVLAEYARVRESTARAAEAAGEVEARITALGRRVRGEAAATADEWVTRLTELRRTQGRLATLREMRHADRGRLDALDTLLARELAEASARAAGHFADPGAFDGYRQRVADVAAQVPQAATAAATEPLAATLNELAEGLATVTGTAGTLEIADATVRTRILATSADVLGAVNHARALLAARRRELLAAETGAEFAAQSALLAQSIGAALDAAGTPEACEEQLGRLLVQIENLATRFAADEERLAALDARREEVRDTFAARKQALTDERAQRAQRLTGSAARLLDGIRRRAGALGSADEIHTYFASDPLATEHRRIAAELTDLGDPARAAELGAALAAARQAAVRDLRDRLDLYEDGGAAIRLGRHRFAVNTQPLDLALVPHADGLAFTVTGTDYLVPVTDPSFAATRAFWSRPLASESPDLSRAEFLAGGLLLDMLAAGGPVTDADEVRGTVRAAVAARASEGYERGVHDHDAALLLTALAERALYAGTLRYPAATRAGALLFWTYAAEPASRSAWTARARSLSRARSAFGGAGAGRALDALAAEIGSAAREFLVAAGLGELTGPTGRIAAPSVDDMLVGEYLVAELAAGRDGFAIGPGARAAVARLTGALGGPDAVPYKELGADLDALGGARDGGLAARWQLARAWLGPFAGEGPGQADTGDTADLVEAAAGLVCGAGTVRYAVDAEVQLTVRGLLAAHPRAVDGAMTLRLDELLARVRRFAAEEVPAHQAYQRHRTAVVAAERARLALDGYRARPPAGFVRNRLLDEVYLPLVGDSLDKQFGPAGGLLMLLSPPGYGKTSLVEYVASSLGLALVAVSGPALGNGTTSLDPDRAPDAAARRELEKVRLALEMGSNVLLYLDDIQHASTEFLQKFIPLCDAQRRIEGPGGAYDLRGKRFAVCMAGNPYTESGALFRVPDMLANRADVWNLGDVLDGRQDLFALSYVENALTANPVLAPLAARDRADLDLLVRLAAENPADPAARAADLAHPYSEAERTEVLAVLRHLLRARDTLLAVNAAYIASATGAASGAAGTGEPFLLQGSYRSMNRIAGRITATMNAAEAEAVITDHYRAEAQTLAHGAQASLRRLDGIRGDLARREGPTVPHPGR
ncbi:ATPase family associated with various cellular activities (AAA) [Actinacidiphila yanglinensis]|uniref:ATPase family associated with various cellular activities (AAA) n=1 Tax=Actinacidiphila yanglinensis TaxID=310779 RepID=A0A1H5YZM4_9ACTN|nr:DNA repair ATPase [Actinacidiphila yanglinensis]SEG29352.1 ATPase family associated with various cellular activities (AAA) [Actinacidiphila yanglinensis]